MNKQTRHYLINSLFYLALSIVAIALVICNVVMARYVWIVVFSLLLAWYLTALTIHSMAWYRASRSEIKVKFNDH